MSLLCFASLPRCHRQSPEEDVLQSMAMHRSDSGYPTALLPLMSRTRLTSSAREMRSNSRFQTIAVRLHRSIFRPSSSRHSV